MVKFAVSIPNNYMGDAPSIGQIKDFIREAEGLGFESLWVLERLNHKQPKLDPLVTLAMASSITTKIRLGTSVLVLNLHDPILLAKSLATLDFVSGGRVNVGVAMGSRLEEYMAVGRTFKDRVARFEEAVEVMKRAWTEDDLNIKTDYRELQGVSINPKPMQKPHPPLLIGGESDESYKRAATMGDGYLGGTSRTPELWSAAWQKVQRYAREAGRDPTSLQSVAMIYCLIDSDRERAGRTLASRLGGYYITAPEERKTDFAKQAYGTVSDCVSRIEPFVKMAKIVMLVATTPDLEQLRRYEKDIVRSF